MLIFAIDDERLALEALISAIRKAVPQAEVRGFRKVMELLEAIRTETPEVVFLDVEMKKMNGIDLAQEIKKKFGDINLIFASGFSQYTCDAFAIHASGYVMKPVTPEKIKNEIDNLRFPIREEKHLLQLQCFGNFEVFFDGTPLKFKYNKTKELLAYLVDRNGAMCSNSELMAVLWEDECNSEKRISYLKNLRADLCSVLEGIGEGELITRAWGKMGIRRDEVNCDYYRWLDGNRDEYYGEYMTQYSWTEFTNAALMDDYQRRMGEL